MKTMKILEFRSNNFDVIRLAAAMQVVLLHSHEHMDAFKESTQLPFQILGLFPGVTIFFIISGFLVGASWERTPNILSYLRNRFLRIYPGLWACFLFSLLSVVFFSRQTIFNSEILPWSLAQLSIGQFYNPEFLRGYGVGVLNGSLWTIPVELQFYLILPIIYYIFRKIHWNKFIISGIIAVFICINQYFFSLQNTEKTLLVKLYGVTAFPYLYVFILGIILQRNRDFIANYLRGKAFIWLILYLMVNWSMNICGQPIHGNQINPVSTIFLSLLVISCAYSCTGIFNNALKGNDISYGVYIYHMVIINILVEISVKQGIAMYITGIAITLFIAFISWRLIEKPAINLKKHSIKLKTAKRLVTVENI